MTNEQKQPELPARLRNIEGWQPFPEKRPVVFMFQPTHYKMISSNEDLVRWERLMREQVGMDPGFFHVRAETGLQTALAAAYPNGGECFCPAGDGGVMTDD